MKKMNKNVKTILFVALLCAIVAEGYCQHPKSYYHVTTVHIFQPEAKDMRKLLNGQVEFTPADTPLLRIAYGRERYTYKAKGVTGVWWTYKVTRIDNGMRSAPVYRVEIYSQQAELDKIILREMKLSRRQ